MNIREALIAELMRISDEELRAKSEIVGGTSTYTIIENGSPFIHLYTTVSDDTVTVRREYWFHDGMTGVGRMFLFADYSDPTMIDQYINVLRSIYAARADWPMIDPFQFTDITPIR